MQHTICRRAEGCFARLGGPHGLWGIPVHHVWAWRHCLWPES